jgi:NhaP-type Na+/H+ or K+/H+ antiporter
MADTMLAVGAALLGASLFIAFFRRTKIPDVLLLILVGLGFGPLAGWVTPADFGRVGAAASTIALTVILFESGLSLEIEALRRSARLTLALSLAGFLSTAALVAAFAYGVLRLDWMMACATGAIVGGTSSAVVIPLVKQLGVDPVVGTALSLESALTDVLCIIVAYACLNAVVAGTASLGAVIGGVLLSLGKAVIIGGVAAVLLLFVVEWVRALPNATVGVIAAALVVFGVAERFGASGAIASLSFGFTLANRQWLRIGRLAGFEHVEDLVTPRYLLWFLSDLIFILKTFFFVFLGISMQIDDTRALLWSAALILGAYAARALVVRFIAPASVSRQDAGVMAIMAPKGLAAAVLAGVPAQMGLPGGAAIQQFVFGIVLTSIVITSVAVPLLPRWPWSRLVDVVFPGHAQAGAEPGTPGSSG